jgi:hypothetical protein
MSVDKERLLVDRGDPFAVAGCRERGQVGLAEAYFGSAGWDASAAGCVFVPVHWDILDPPLVAVEGNRLVAVLVV